MGLFDKKYCDICGEKIGLLGNRKLEDGNLCKNCAKKLSPWFDERRHSTVDQIKQQLAYREENKAKVAAFHTTAVIGRDSTKLYIDDHARKFAVHRGNDFETANPDILDYSQALGCDLDIREDRDEIRRTVDGRSESYNPPRYEYSYDFRVTIRVDHPYFNEMTFDLNGRAVETGETQMSGGSLGSWNINRVGSYFGHSVGMNEYNEFIEMGNSLKNMIEGWRNSAPSSNVSGTQGETIRFGSENPVPMDALVGNQRVSLGILYFGECEIAAINPATAQNFGGVEALKNTLHSEILTIANDAVHNFGIQCMTFNDLTAKTDDITNYLKMSLEQRWSETYGLKLTAVNLKSLTLTEDSRRIVNQIEQSQSAQAFSQQQTQDYAQQPVQSANAFCPFCGTPNPGKFCPNCGAKQ